MAILETRRIRPSKRRHMDCGISRIVSTISGKVFSVQGICPWNGLLRSMGKILLWGGIIPTNAEAGMRLGGTSRNTRDSGLSYCLWLGLSACAALI